MKNSLLLLAILSALALQSVNAQGFYDTDKVQDIRIQFPFDNWSYLLDSLRFNGSNMLAGNVTINGRSFENVGVRIESDQPFNPGEKRNSLFIQLNLFDENQTLDGHTSLHLSNTLRDPSMVREVLGFEIARAYMPAPQANYANVRINGELVGLYANIQTIDAFFLETHFGSSNGDFFQARSHSPYDNFPQGCKQRIYGSLEYETESECYLYNFNQHSKGAWNNLIELTRILNQQPDKIESVLNVDRTLWMHAFNNVLVNLNSYAGQYSENFYLYRDEKGIFQPVIWDLNLCFGSFKNTGQGSDLRLKQLQELDPTLHASNLYKPLISQLMKNETYKKMYMGHVRSIVHDFFKNRRYEQRAKDLQMLVQQDFVRDPNKQYRYEEFNVSLYSTIGKRSTIPGIIELMAARSEYLTKNTDVSVVPPQITDINVQGREKFSNVQVDNFFITAKVDKFPRRVRVMYRFDEAAPFAEITMTDDGKGADKTANDGLYSALINPPKGASTLEYYLMAENASIMGFSPADYMWNRYKTSLEELNQ
jgi:spore coat protein CotH